MIFYPGPNLRITHEVLEVNTPFYQRFAIGELQQVHIARVKRGDHRTWRLARPYALRAMYRGHLVDLFQTTDRLTLGQVSRALRRALERLEDAREVRSRPFHPVG